MSKKNPQFLKRYTVGNIEGLLQDNLARKGGREEEKKKRKEKIKPVWQNLKNC